MAEAALKETPAAALDVESVRAQFPVLSRAFDGGKPVAFLDSAASAQKPHAVIDAMGTAMGLHYANIHRGVYQLSQEATAAFEAVRGKVRGLINAAREEEIIFTRNTTEAINLVAHSWGRVNLRAGDEIIISRMEHHANIVPWQLLAAEKGLTIRVAEIDQAGNFLLDGFRALLNDRTKLVAITHMSNALGTVTPLKEIVDAAHAAGAVVMVDGTQAVCHSLVDVQALGADFYAFTGHKLYGPTGVGVLYGRYDLLEAMPPYQGGGDMIDKVRLPAGTTFAAPPARFEAGTPAIVEVIGLGAAIDWMRATGIEAIAAHEAALMDYAVPRLKDIPGLSIIGEAEEKGPVLSLKIDGLHPHDVGTILDKSGVSVRAGHHCAQPLMEFYGVPGTARASFSAINTTEEVDRLVDGLTLARELLA